MTITYSQRHNHSEDDLGTISTTLDGSWQAGDLCIALVAGMTTTTGTRTLTVNLPDVDTQQDFGLIEYAPEWRVTARLAAKTLTADDLGDTITATASDPFWVGYRSGEWALMLTRIRDTAPLTIVASEAGGADAAPGSGPVTVYGPVSATPAGATAVSMAVGVYSAVGMQMRPGYENGWTIESSLSGQSSEWLGFSWGSAVKALPTAGDTSPMPGWRRTATNDGYCAFTFVIAPLPSPSGWHIGSLRFGSTGPGW